VANAGLKVAVFSWSCGKFVRVAGKGLSEEGLDPETQSAKRFGKEGMGAGSERNMRNVSKIPAYCQ
jgi:hypothetical protein